MKQLLFLPAFVLILCATLSQVSQAQTAVARVVMASGGGISTGTNVFLRGTVAQPIIGQVMASEVRAEAGFWASGAFVLRAPAAPLLQAPEDGSLNVETAPTLVWNAVAGALSYDVQVSTDDTFTMLVIDLSGLTATSTAPLNLDPNTTYHWRIRGVNTIGPGPYATARFTTVNNVGTEDAVGIPTEFRLEGNYPNPFNPQTTIRFAVPSAAHVHLAVYDLHGRLVRTLIDAPHTPGLHEATFDARSLASGVYLYRMTAGPFTATRRMLLVK